MNATTEARRANETRDLPPHDVVGEGPTLLLIHGTGADAASWAAIQKLLAGRFRTISYDRRAHSRNRAPYPTADVEAAHAADAAALIEEYGAPACVVGWSRGGLVAIELALRHPSLVSQLVLFEPPLHAPKHGDARMMFGMVSTMLLSALGFEQAAARRFLRMATAAEGGNDFERLPEDARARTLANARTIIAELKIGTLEHRDAAALGTLQPPVHVLAGTRSPAMLRRAARFLATATGGKMTTLEGVGHVAPVDAPEVLAGAIAACADAAPSERRRSPGASTYLR